MTRSPGSGAGPLGPRLSMMPPPPPVQIQHRSPGGHAFQVHRVAGGGCAASGPRRTRRRTRARSRLSPPSVTARTAQAGLHPDRPPAPPPRRPFCSTVRLPSESPSPSKRTRTSGPAPRRPAGEAAGPRARRSPGPCRGCASRQPGLKFGASESETRSLVLTHPATFRAGKSLLLRSVVRPSKASLGPGGRPGPHCNLSSQDAPKRSWSASTASGSDTAVLWLPSQVRGNVQATRRRMSSPPRALRVTGDTRPPGPVAVCKLGVSGRGHPAPQDRNWSVKAPCMYTRIADTANGTRRSDRLGGLHRRCMDSDEQTEAGRDGAIGLISTVNGLRHWEGGGGSRLLCRRPLS